MMKPVEIKGARNPVELLAVAAMPIVSIKIIGLSARALMVSIKSHKNEFINCVSADYNTFDNFLYLGYIGEPTRSCNPPQNLGGCQYDKDCPENRICDRLNRVCRSPCMQDSCGVNAECFVKRKEAFCRCFEGYIGNAYLACNRRKMQKIYS